MSESHDPKVETITFGRKEIDPEEDAKYKEKIAKAKASGGVAGLKGSTPLGHVPRPTMPNLNARRGDEMPSLTPEGGVQARPPGSPVIRRETQEGLEALAAAQKQTKPEEAPADPMEKEVAGSKEDLLDILDFGAKNEAERILNNKQRRKEIESRCEPMKLEDLIIRDEVQQLVPIQPGKFEALFRSMTPEESLFVKKYISREETTTDQYLMEKYGLCQLCCSLLAINGKNLPDHRDQNGSVDPKLFEAKLKALMKKSGYLIADLGLNFFWFDLRVRRLLNPEDLKNG
jgi:hypothetical protein